MANTIGKTLHGKICLITGASRGIGRSIALLFQREGAVVYANTRTMQDFDQLVTESRLEYESIRNRAERSDNGPEALRPAVFDVTDSAAVKNIVLEIRKQCGKIDVLVNNAGIAFNENIGMISPVHVQEMLDINVKAPIELLQLAARVMMRQKSGSIINIASVVGLNGDCGQTAYSASKGAIIAMTKSAAKELGTCNIRVNAVAPGLTDTDMMHETDREKLSGRITGIPAGRIARPEDIAEACLFLASDRASYITGQVLGVCGGPM